MPLQLRWDIRVLSFRFQTWNRPHRPVKDPLWVYGFIVSTAEGDLMAVSPEWSDFIGTFWNYSIFFFFPSLPVLVLLLPKWFRCVRISAARTRGWVWTSALLFGLCASDALLALWRWFAARGKKSTEMMKKERKSDASLMAWKCERLVKMIV